MVPFNPSKQPVIEHRRVIEAVAIADQRVGEAGEIDEAIPFGIVCGPSARLPDLARGRHGASATSAVSRAKPERVAVPPPDRPRSSSMTMIRSAGQPSSRALLASAYLPLSRFRDCARLERRSTDADRRRHGRARWLAVILARSFMARLVSCRQPPCGQSGAPGSRAQRSARARRAVPRGSLRGSPPRGPPGGSGGSKKARFSCTTAPLLWRCRPRSIGRGRASTRWRN